MKTNSIIYLSAIFMTIGIVTGCCNKTSKGTAPVDEPTAETCFTAIDNYLINEIGSQYLPGDICIPFYPYTAVDDADSDDIQVWGDFWVMNYTVSGDTLKTVSGGSHPGKIHLKKTPDGHFEVTSFETVADGSEWEPSAKSIFGDRFSDFQKSNSDEKNREDIRMKAVAEYVHSHQLPVSIVKDFGWPAVRIPKVE